MNRNATFGCILAVISCAGCQSSGMVGVQPYRGLPSERSFTRDQLVIHADFFLPQRHRVINDLVEMRYEISEQLGLPLAEIPIEIYLFRDEKKFKAFAKRHSLLADRRAFFIKRGDQMKVFSFWGARAEEDLRHEVTHGYLHAITDDLPLWMDEGLAEYFEVRNDLENINWPHVQLLADAYRRGQWRPNLKLLEQVGGNVSLNQLQYAEAWLWVHFLLNYNDSTTELFKFQLQSIIAGEPTETFAFSEALESSVPDCKNLLIGHLKRLAEL